VRGPEPPAPAFPTLGEALAAAASSPAGITFVDLREREIFLPFREVLERARGTAAGLRRLGVEPGDRVAIVLPTAPAFLDAFFGTVLAGAVPVPLYPPYRLGRLDEYHAETAAMVAAAAARLLVTEGRIRAILGRTVERAAPALGCRDVARLGSAAPEPGAAVPRGADDLAFVQFSSGSTAEPKPVGITHGALLAHLAALRQLLPPETDRPHAGVSWLPLYHDMGLVGCLLLAVYYPGPLVLIPPEHFLARPALWPRAVSRHRATLSAAPPFGFAACAARARDGELAGVDLSSWRLAICGAEPVGTEPLDQFAHRFAPYGFDARALCPSYGLAEATLAVTVSPPGRGARFAGVDAARLAAEGLVREGPHRVASVGVPVAGCEVEVRGPDGRALPEGEQGVIHVRGQALMTGYVGLPRETAAALAGGWLDTGDLGFVAAGELHVSGRSKDVVIVRGACRQPREFEECLAGIDGVHPAAAAAVGFLPEGAEGERLLVLAERAEGPGQGGGEDGLAERVARAVLERTGGRPQVVLLPPGALPRTASGKIRRREALRRLVAGGLGPPGAGGVGTLSLELLRSGIGYARAAFRRP